MEDVYTKDSQTQYVRMYDTILSCIHLYKRQLNYSL